MKLKSETQDQDLSIYIHWPFCKSKCPYCDFMSVPKTDPKEYDEVEFLLLKDLVASLQELEISSVRTIFFGGGTPSLMSVRSISKILNFITKNYKTDSDIEISLEANPATFSKQKLKEIKEAGVNRLSLGIQSFLDKNLRFLGRIYNSEQALKAAETVAKMFSNYSFDFIYGYQSQTINDLQKDLTKAVDFGCPHISCYQLTFEPGTPFFQSLQNGKIKQIAEAQEVEFFKHIQNFLKKFSFNRYEISNYALKNFESKHNLGYWRYQNYLGVGPSAHSRLVFNNQKYELKKFSDINKWKSYLYENLSTYEEKNPLTDYEQLEEIFIMGLRLSEGISIKNLRSRFPENILNPIWEKIDYLFDENLLEKSQTQIKLSEIGTLKQNSIVEFLFN
ncbi:MAG: radical SAM family heme chaperone HemW [Alphaproteobacteria bacterium]|nr:radical SAM family heme chaperone HemW [Alphaproteobacteria bacterium]